MRSIKPRAIVEMVRRKKEEKKDSDFFKKMFGNLRIVVDPDMPQNEIWIEQDNKICRILNLDTNEITDFEKGKQN